MRHRAVVIWFGLVAALALYSRWWVEHDRTGRCSLDGTRIAPIYRVDLVVDGRVTKSFCCVKCAQEWPGVPDGSYWQVRDEVTGQVLDAERACFVVSSVVTVPSRQDRTHVFKDWADGLTHATQRDGHRIPNPLPKGSQRVPRSDHGAGTGAWQRARLIPFGALCARERVTKRPASSSGGVQL